MSKLAMKRRAQEDGDLTTPPPFAPSPPAISLSAHGTGPADDLPRCNDPPQGDLSDTSNSSDESVTPAPVTCSRKKSFRIKPDSDSDWEASGDLLCDYFDRKPSAKRLPSKNFCCYSIFYDTDSDCVEHPDPSDGEIIPCAGGRCPYNFHFHKKCCRRWENLQVETRNNLDVEDITQYFCPCCHPWGRQPHFRTAIEDKAFGRRSDQKPAAKTKRQRKRRKKQPPSSPTAPPAESTVEQPAESSLYSASNVKSFICHLADDKPDDKSRDPDERFDDVCDAFTKKIVLEGHGTINAQTKVAWLRRVLKIKLGSLLSGDLLTRAKKQRCHERLTDILKKSKPTIVNLSIPAMQLGRLIHEQQCQDDMCPHCENPRRDMPIPVNDDSRLVMELFEAASEVVVNRDRGERERKERGRRNQSKTIKSYPDSMFTIQGFPRNYRYREKMVCQQALFVLARRPRLISQTLCFFLKRDPDHGCPVCGHKYTTKLIEDHEFQDEEDELQRDYRQRKAKYDNTKKSARSSQPPRLGRKKLKQQFVCPCWTFRGKHCPLCKGKAKRKQDPNGPEGSMISSCPLCECNCALGPFKNSDRENLAAAYHEYVAGIENRPTVSEIREAGLSNLAELTNVAIQNGIRDCRELDMEITEDSVQGAAVDYINEAEITEEAKYNMGKEIGVPTDRMSDGLHISELQKRERGTVGLRGHKIEQSRARARSTQQQQQHVRAPTKKPSGKRVTMKRTKKQLRKLALKGSPATQVAGEECLEDMAMGRRSSALDRIREAEEDSEDSVDEGVTQSQQVAIDAIHFKKLEQRRKNNK